MVETPALLLPESLRRADLSHVDQARVPGEESRKILRITSAEKDLP